jgi:Protein of unknown function (DUF3072)
MSSIDKEPDEWLTGDDPMTDAQASYLQRLCEQTSEHFDPGLSKAEASKLIDELQQRSSEGR